MRRIVMRQHSPLAACLYDIQHCFYQWSLMIFAFISGWKEFFDCFPLLVCQITFVICCFIFFFHFSYYITFSLWTQALRRLFSFSNALIRFLSCWFSSAIFWDSSGLRSPQPISRLPLFAFLIQPYSVFTGIWSSFAAFTAPIFFASFLLLAPCTHFHISSISSFSYFIPLRLGCQVLLYYINIRQPLQKQTQNEPPPLQLPKIERNLKKPSFFLDKEYSIML